MNHRQDIVDMLLAGHSQRAVMRALNVSYTAVSTVRRALALPRSKPGSVPEAIEVTFARRTKATADGHLLWLGSNLYITYEARHLAIRRWVFKRRYGRPPVGRVMATCQVPQCVHPDHLEDGRQRAQYAAIFG